MILGHAFPNEAAKEWTRESSASASDATYGSPVHTSSCEETPFRDDGRHSQSRGLPVHTSACEETPLTGLRTQRAPRACPSRRAAAAGRRACLRPLRGGSPPAGRVRGRFRDRPRDGPPWVDQWSSPSWPPPRASCRARRRTRRPCRHTRGSRARCRARRAPSRECEQFSRTSRLHETSPRLAERLAEPVELLGHAGGRERRSLLGER